MRISHGWRWLRLPVASIPMTDPAPIGEAMTALRTVKAIRALLACEGWEVMWEHLKKERDEATRMVLEEEMSHEDREKKRAEYRVYQSLLTWPQRTLDAQLSVLESTKQDQPDGLPE